MPSTRNARRLTLAYLALAGVDTWLSAHPAPWAHRARRVSKPLLMPTLAASLQADPRATTSPLRTTTLLAEAGGWGGDVALLSPSTGAFLTGTGSFALGHVAYLAGFLRHRGPGPLRSTPGARVVAAAWTLSAPALALMAGRRQRELGLPVLGYATVLAAMAACASRLDPALPRVARAYTAAGAGLFMVSDSVLALRAFVLEEPPAWLERVVMATYTTAQLLLREGAARA